MSPDRSALERSYLAQLRGDAEATAAFAARVLTCSGEEEWLLSSTTRGFLAVAEWLRGRLAAAEHAFIGRHRRVAERRAGHRGRMGQLSARPGSAPPRAGWSAAILTCQQAVQATAGSGSTPLPPAWVPRTSAWARWPTSATSSTSRCAKVSEGIALSASSCTPRRSAPASCSAGVDLPGHRRPGRSPSGHGRGQGRPRRYRPACSTRSRRSGRGCSSPGDLAAAARFAQDSKPPTARTTSQLRPRIRAPGPGQDPARPEPGPARRSRCSAGSRRRPGPPPRRPHRDRRAARAGPGSHQR